MHSKSPEGTLNLFYLQYLYYFVYSYILISFNNINKYNLYILTKIQDIAV